MAEVDDRVASLRRERTVNEEDEVERSEDQAPEKVEAAQVSHQLKKQKRHRRNSWLCRDVLFQFFIKLRQSVVVVTNHNLELLANLGRL